MSRLRPNVLERLARSRLGIRHAEPGLGVGERRSNATGAGLEFADHREYQPGDDIRFLDRHAHVRLGQQLIRQYSTYRQASITVVLDGTKSMDGARRMKWRTAADVAGALAFVGLAGGDAVQIAVMNRGGLHWWRRSTGTHHMHPMLKWLNSLEPAGADDWPAVRRQLAPATSAAGPLVVVSDFLSDDVLPVLKSLAEVQQELITVQVLDRLERHPDPLAKGYVELVDVESHQGVLTSVDAEVIAHYCREVEAWITTLRSVVERHRGRYFFAYSDAPLDQLLFREWRGQGLIV